MLILVCYSATGLREAHTNWSITKSEMLRHVSTQCYLRLRATDPISVAFIDQVALFSDFNRIFELHGPGFAAYDSIAFYMLE